MHDQWVEARPALGGEDSGDGALVGRVGAEAVDRLGRERDELAAAQQRGGAVDCLESGGDDPFHRATLSARRCSRKIGAGKRWRNHMIDKFVRSVAEAMAGIKDGSTVLVAGFAQIGEPRALIDGLIEQGAKDLTVVHNTAGRGREGVARLIGEGRVRKIVCSFARSRGSVLFEEVYARGDIELEMVPQGTLAERIRAGGAGIPAFFTPTGGGTLVARGKETRVIDGRECVLEQAIRGDVALVEAWRADRWGNLVYRDAGRNFNPIVAAAGELTIAQTQNIAELGELTPEMIVTPGIYVDRVVHVPSGDPPVVIS